MFNVISVSLYVLECNCVVGQVLGNIYGDKRILHLLMLLIIIDFKMALSITLLHAPIISLCFLSFRFHTFALGFEICSELMSSLAAVTEGEYRVITENDRLQTKVIINPVVPILTSPLLGYGSSSDHPLTFSSKSVHHFLSSQWLLSNEG